MNLIHSIKTRGQYFYIFFLHILRENKHDTTNPQSQNQKFTKMELAISQEQMNNDQTSSSLNLPAEQIRSNSSPPAAYSITMARWVGVKTTYKSKKNPQI